jgi:hypothetical protein
MTSTRSVRGFASAASAAPASDSGTGVMPLEFLASDAVAELAATGKAAKLLALVIQQLAASETEVCAFAGVVSGDVKE